MTRALSRPPRFWGGGGRGAGMSALLFTLLMAALLGGCQDPPAQSLDRSERALAHARRSGGATLAPDTFRKAEETVQQGRLEVARQKGRLAPLRDYRVADSLLDAGARLAEKAATHAQAKRGKMQAQVRLESRDLQRDLEVTQSLAVSSLARVTLGKLLVEAELSLKLGQALADSARYDAALASLARTRDLLVRCDEALHQAANGTQERRDQWDSWVSQTVRTSRQRGTSAVIVDKAAHRTYLVKQGKVVHTYECDLGYNSARQKTRAGDGATPEGQYRVTQVKKRGSIYYKAALVDYPNGNDRKRFQQNLQSGVIPRNSEIGGLIEIHGHGGRGRDWTNGCVALTNEDMDHLLQHIDVGTPVTIVRTSPEWP